MYDFRASGLQGFRVSGLQGFRASGFQGFRAHIRKSCAPSAVMNCSILWGASSESQKSPKP